MPRKAPADWFDALGPHDDLSLPPLTFEEEQQMLSALVGGRNHTAHSLSKSTASSRPKTIILPNGSASTILPADPINLTSSTYTAGSGKQSLPQDLLKEFNRLLEDSAKKDFEALSLGKNRPRDSILSSNDEESGSW